jgi:hypothetical protein
MQHWLVDDRAPIEMCFVGRIAQFVLMVRSGNHRMMASSAEIKTSDLPAPTASDGA